MSLLNSWRKSNRRRQTNKQEWSIFNHFSLDPYLHLCVHMAACCLSKHHRSSVASLSKQTGWHWPGAHSCHKSRGGYVCCKQTHHDSDARRSKLGQVVGPREWEDSTASILLWTSVKASSWLQGRVRTFLHSSTPTPPSHCRIFQWGNWYNLCGGLSILWYRKNDINAIDAGSMNEYNNEKCSFCSAEPVEVCGNNFI